MTERCTLYFIVKNFITKRITNKIKLGEDTKKYGNWQFKNLDIYERIKISMRYHLNFYYSPTAVQSLTIIPLLWHNQNV